MGVPVIPKLLELLWYVPLELPSKPVLWHERVKRRIPWDSSKVVEKSPFLCWMGPVSKLSMLVLDQIFLKRKCISNLKFLRLDLTKLCCRCCPHFGNIRKCRYIVHSQMSYFGLWEDFCKGQYKKLCCFQLQYVYMFLCLQLWSWPPSPLILTVGPPTFHWCIWCYSY